MENPPPDRPFPVIYVCWKCGGRFTVWQGDGEPDEDITLCWQCVDNLLNRRTM